MRQLGRHRPGLGLQLAVPRCCRESRAPRPRPRCRRLGAGAGTAAVRRGAGRGRLPLRAVGAGIRVRAGHRRAYPRQPGLHHARRHDPRASVERRGHDRALDLRRQRPEVPRGVDAPGRGSRPGRARRHRRRPAVVRDRGQYGGRRERPVRNPDPRRPGRPGPAARRQRSGAARPPRCPRRLAAVGARAGRRLRRLPRRAQPGTAAGGGPRAVRPARCRSDGQATGGPRSPARLCPERRDVVDAPGPRRHRRARARHRPRDRHGGPARIRTPRKAPSASW